MATCQSRWGIWITVLLAIVGLALLAGCDAGSAPTPTLPPTPVTRTVRAMPTFTPVPKNTETPVPPTTTDTPPPPTTTDTPAATDTPVPTATNTPRPRPTKTPAPPPTATTPPFMYMPDGSTRHEANPSFTEIRGMVRAADGTPLDGVIVMLDTGGLKIPLPTGQRPGYYSWVWCDWARDGTFTLYVLGPDGQPASPFVTVQTFSKDLMAIAIQDWKRTW